MVKTFGPVHFRISVIWMFMILKKYVLFFTQSGQFSEDMIPTVGFNMRKITKGNVTIKVAYICSMYMDSYYIMLNMLSMI